ncbi:MaoC family dehydratase N-terminal domain-containing protein [Mameliella alba]|nr:MaoC family dehydratase N-terminal domain-containing protein [Mameliella alba]MBY6170468.1 MaoC family dehydratase N-terminal domain-containing protein [Mameliella alba]MBY6175486.1 MaoC family dehydratase N-terminal domain-containing protein [Mameliella alba]
MIMEIDHLRGWIGREDSLSEILTPTLVARFAATFDRDVPLDNGADAPAMIHLCLCHPAAPTTALASDGHPRRGGFLPPVPLPRRMWAGGEIVFAAAPRIGETITRRSVIEDVATKQGRSGALCFVTVRHHYTAGERRLLSERQDIVYREAAQPGTTPPAPPPAESGPYRRSLTAGPALLFRYSALTFNGHRIHYDLPYATETEGYPGLMVHGPMQATLLAQMAEDQRGTPPKTFRFRSLSPLFDRAPVMLNARDDGAGGVSLWTSAPGGPVAMEAQATW